MANSDVFMLTLKLKGDTVVLIDQRGSKYRKYIFPRNAAAGYLSEQLSSNLAGVVNLHADTRTKLMCDMTSQNYDHENL